MDSKPFFCLGFFFPCFLFCILKCKTNWAFSCSELAEQFCCAEVLCGNFGCVVHFGEQISMDLNSSMNIFIDIYTCVCIYTYICVYDESLCLASVTVITSSLCVTVS